MVKVPHCERQCQPLYFPSYIYKRQPPRDTKKSIKKHKKRG